MGIRPQSAAISWRTQPAERFGWLHPRLAPPMYTPMALYGDADQADIADLDGAAQASKPSPLRTPPALAPTGAWALAEGLAGAREGSAAGVSLARSTMRRAISGWLRQVVVTRTPAEGTSTRSSLESPAAGSCVGAGLPFGARSVRAERAVGAARASGSTDNAVLRRTTCAGHRCSAPGCPS